MCTWCDGWWECDGEGGDCGGLPGDKDCPPIPIQTPQPGWKVDCLCRLKDAHGNEVVNSKGHVVKLRIVASGGPGPDGLEVKINGERIEPDNDGEECPPPRLPHAARGRQWRINHRYTVKDQDGEPIEVRVQAYAYPYKPEHHDANPKHVRVPGGWGPKVRVMAIPEPVGPGCSDAQPGKA